MGDHVIAGRESSEDPGHEDDEIGHVPDQVKMEPPGLTHRYTLRPANVISHRHVRLRDTCGPGLRSCLFQATQGAVWHPRWLVAAPCLRCNTRDRGHCIPRSAPGFHAG